jgi:hypothetical protein
MSSASSSSSDEKSSIPTPTPVDQKPRPSPLSRSTVEKIKDFIDKHEKREDNPFIPVVPRKDWISKAVYDPTKSFAEQIQENQLKKGNAITDSGRFTTLSIRNLIFGFETEDTPYKNSEWRLSAHVKDGIKKEQINFTLLNGCKWYRGVFDGAEEVDEFLQHVHKNCNHTTEQYLAEVDSFRAEQAATERRSRGRGWFD